MANVTTYSSTMDPMDLEMAITWGFPGQHVPTWPCALSTRATASCHSSPARGCRAKASRASRAFRARGEASASLARAWATWGWAREHVYHLSVITMI